MNTHKHIIDHQLVQYINIPENLCEKDISYIEKHIFNNPCDLCKKKYEELLKFNKSIEKKVSYDYLNDDDIEFCVQANLIEDFINKKLDKINNKNLIKHLAECNLCREIIATLVSTDALNELYQEKESLWELMKDGIYRLKNTFVINIDTIKETLVGDIYNPISLYRGEESNDKSNQLKVIDLPQSKIKLKVYYTIRNTNTVDITFEQINNDSEELLIEIFSEQGLLIQSIERIGSIVCTVPKGKFTIMFNEKYEFILDII